MALTATLAQIIEHGVCSPQNLPSGKVSMDIARPTGWKRPAKRHLPLDQDGWEPKEGFWTVKAAEVLLTPPETRVKKFPSKYDYVSYCHRNFFNSFSADIEDGYLEKERFLAKLCAAGWNHLPPRDWAEQFPSFLRFWNESQARPDRVDSFYNLSPQVAFDLWKKGIPPHKARIGRGLPDMPFLPVADVLGRNEGLSIPMAEKLELIRSPWLLHFPIGDRRRAMKAIRLFGYEARWVLRELCLQDVREEKAHWDREPGVDYKRGVDWKQFQTAIRMKKREFYISYAPMKAVWQFRGRFIPDLPRDTVTPLNSLSKREVWDLPWKFVLRAKSRMEEVLAGDGHDAFIGASNILPELAVRIAQTFGSDWKRYLRKANTTGEIHDLCHWLPVKASPGLGRYLLKRGGDFVSDSRLHRIANAWNYLTEEEKRLSISDLAAKLAAKKYESSSHTGFAEMAAMAGVGIHQYKEMETRWLNGINNVPSESIPYVSINHEGYRIHRLLRGDPRGLFLGVLTNCCQHPDGAGASCAWHGVEDPDGAFFVIEDSKGKIVAQSWAWRNESWVCFDNIEALGGLESRRDTIVALYQKAADALIGQLGIKAVSVGVGYSDIDIGQWPPISDGETPSSPENCYSDADDQRLIASEEGIFGLEEGGVYLID